MNIEAFLQSLPLMCKGMLGMFLVAGVIILAMVLLNKLTAGRK